MKKNILIYIFSVFISWGISGQNHRSMLVGSVEQQDLLEAPFNSWYSPRYTAFEPNPAAMETIKKNIPDVDNIKIFFGSWCPDSKRELPDFMKILEKSNYELDKVDLIAMDRGKSTPENLEQGFDILMVPTIIFYKNGKEINRFVEYPQESLEKDVAKILTGETYHNSYAN